MKTWLSLFAMLVLTLPESAGATGGLIHQLPADGTWVRYLAEMKQPAGGPDMSGTITLRIVGTEKELGETYRWLELEINLKSDQKTEQSVLKALVREKDLKSGAKQGLKIARGWSIRVGNAKGAKAVPLQDFEKMRKGPLGMYFGSAFVQSAVVKTAKTIDYQKGRLQIHDAIAGRLDLQLQENPAGDSKVTIRQTIWKHKNVPNGAALLEFEVIQDAATLQHLTLTVQDFGKNGRSALPDNK